ncbi:Hypothetical protein FKW44_003211 [Caligus rogercresseyi]|uniref:Uncharacterized protein n=1 Tax=Caligus rogercresseyi TaxID=217165 RepID=A0A7T8QWS4_CALRO|nr:Hypothetical protein FKW44_003211 [Caligus rogercresseyi]
MNIDVYLCVLKEVVKPWMDEKASGDVYNGRYQQDSVPYSRLRRPRSGSRLMSLLSRTPDMPPPTPLT